MEWVAPAVFGIVSLIGLIFSGLPVGFSLITVGVAGMLIWGGIPQMLGMLGSLCIYQTPVNFMLLVIPIFIFMAQILSQFKTTEILYRAFWNLFGGIRGALATATIGIGALLGACMGASAANVATMAHLGLDQMLARDYKRWMAAGAIAGAGGLAIVIPPSIPAITYAFVMELPILDVFAACLFPGILMAVGYVIVTIGYPMIKSDIAPSAGQVPLRSRIEGFFITLPFLGLVVLVLGSIFSGLASITESASFGCLGAFTIALTMGERLNLKRQMLEAGRESATTTCYILWIVIGAIMFGQFWTYTGVIDSVASWISKLPFPRLLIILLMNILVLFFGTIMDQLGIILVVLPILVKGLLPLGFHPLHLGVIFMVNIEMGLTTPPVGTNIFVLGGVAEQYGVTYTDILVGSVPFLVVDALVIIAVVLFPELALWLPGILH